jgi:hypothetical protein
MLQNPLARDKLRNYLHIKWGFSLPLKASGLLMLNSLSNNLHTVLIVFIVLALGLSVFFPMLFLFIVMVLFSSHTLHHLNLNPKSYV